MSLAEFLKQVDLEELAQRAGLTLKESLPSTSETIRVRSSNSVSPRSQPINTVTTNFPPSGVQSTVQHVVPDTRVFKSPLPSSQGRRAISKSLEGKLDGRNKRRNRGTSAGDARQKLNGLIDELWQLIPEEKRNAQEGEFVCRTQKLEMAIEVLKQLQGQ